MCPDGSDESPFTFQSDRIEAQDAALWRETHHETPRKREREPCGHSLELFTSYRYGYVICDIIVSFDDDFRIHHSVVVPATRPMMGRRIEISIHFEAGHSPIAGITGCICCRNHDHRATKIFGLGVKIPEKDDLKCNNNRDVADSDNPEADRKFKRAFGT